MKVHSAVVKLVLRTNKTLADGTHPIMLRVSYGGTKEVSTHCSCKKNEWDAKNMQVKKNVRNWAVINSNLRDVLRYYQDARDALEALKTPYTASMVLEWNPDKDKKAKSSKLMEIEKEYEAENALSAQTIPNRRSVVRLIERHYGREVDIVELTTEKVAAIIRDEVKNGRSEGYLKQVYRIVNSLIKFAIKNGYKVTELDSKVGKRLAEGHSLSYVHRRSIEYIKEYLLDEVTIRRGGGWRYRDDRVPELLNPHSPLFSIYLWLFSYLFQGLAPIDCALLKTSNLRSIIVGEHSYWAIDLARSKTRHSVKIRVRKEGVFNLVMVNTMLMFRNSEYLLPILDGIEATDSKKVRGRLCYRLTFLRPLLKAELKKVNDRIILHNVEHSDDVPIVDVNKVNFYAARHSYAMAYIHSPNASPIALATLLGRSVNTLGTYIHQLTEESDITAAADVLV